MNYTQLRLLGFLFFFFLTLRLVTLTKRGERVFALRQWDQIRGEIFLFFFSCFFFFFTGEHGATRRQERRTHPDIQLGHGALWEHRN